MGPRRTGFKPAKQRSFLAHGRRKSIADVNIAQVSTVGDVESLLVSEGIDCRRPDIVENVHKLVVLTKSAANKHKEDSAVAVDSERLSDSDEKISSRQSSDDHRVSRDTQSQGQITVNNTTTMYGSHHGREPYEMLGIDPSTPVDIFEFLKAHATEEEAYDGDGPTQQSSDTLVKAFTGGLAVNHFRQYCESVMRLYNEVLNDNSLSGTPYAAFNHLDTDDEEAFGVSICTVDGQIFSFGDVDNDVPILDAVKPLLYSIACETTGVGLVHKYVGIEASGVPPDEVVVNKQGKPLNPMMNTGTLMVCALMQGRNDSTSRFRYLQETVSKFIGNGRVGFSQPSYLHEKEVSHQNQALLYFLQSANAFPPRTNTEEVLDLYQQACSLEISCDDVAVLAATYANGGICPLTDERCLSTSVVKNTLSLMLSAGLYQHSGDWVGSGGLPAKAGLTGLMYVVVPGVMGIAAYSPKLTKSTMLPARAYAFCEKIVKASSYGIFDKVVFTDRQRMSTAQRERHRSDIAVMRMRELWIKILLKFTRCCLRFCDLFLRMHSGKEKEGETVAAKQMEDVAGKSFSSQRHFAFKNATFRAAVKAGVMEKGIHIKHFENFLKRKGIEPASVSTRKLLHRMTTKRRIFLRNLFPETKRVETVNFAVKALLEDLVIKDFNGFALDVAAIAAEVEGATEGEIPDDLAELRRFNEESFGIAICTVDGQQFSLGDANVDVPIMSVSYPLLFALALSFYANALRRRDCGLDKVDTVVGRQGSGMGPDGFEVDRKGRPFHPFMSSGALAICSLLQTGKDAGTRFNYIVDNIKEFCGGTKVGFSQPAYLNMKEALLRIKAIAYFLKGRGCFDEKARPNELVDILYQSQAVETSCESLAVMAATCAAMGKSPVTGKRLFDDNVAKELLSSIYSCGMNAFTGTWQFNVGIPAMSSPSGVVVGIVPNLMGIAIYSPRCNEYKVSNRGFKFMSMLTDRFRMNIFDQLVFGDKHVEAVEEEKPDERNAPFEAEQHKESAFMQLCFAAANGDLPRVKAIVDELSADVVTMSDYDGRTPLHLACSESNKDIVTFLVQCGASPLSVDRWGSTPYQDAVKAGAVDVVNFLEEKFPSLGSMALSAPVLQHEKDKGSEQAQRRRPRERDNSGENSLRSKHQLHSRYKPGDSDDTTGGRQRKISQRRVIIDGIGPDNIESRSRGISPNHRGAETDRQSPVTVLANAGAEQPVRRSRLFSNAGAGKELLRNGIAYSGAQNDKDRRLSHIDEELRKTYRDGDVEDDEEETESSQSESNRTSSVSVTPQSSRAKRGASEASSAGRTANRTSSAEQNGHSGSKQQGKQDLPASDRVAEQCELPRPPKARNGVVKRREVKRNGTSYSSPASGASSRVSTPRSEDVKRLADKLSKSSFEDDDIE